MAFQTISPVPYTTKNNINYNLEYDKSTGQVQLIQQNAPTGTSSIYSDGKWNTSGAAAAGFTSQEQQVIHENIQTSIRNTFKTLGGVSAGLVLPVWAQQQNQGQPAGQSTSTPSQNVSTNATSPANIGAAFGAILNPSEAIQELANQEYGVKGQEDLFRALKYPIDMNSLRQDTLAISQYEYQAPSGQALLSGDLTRIIQQGLQRGSDFRAEKVIGTVTFPMPSSLSEGKEVGWGPDQMNNISAGVMSDVIKSPEKYAVGGVLGAVTGAIINKKVMGGSVMSGAGTGAQTGAGAIAMGQAAAAASGTPEGQGLIGSIAVQKLLQLAQFNTEIETILARGAGIVPNNNLELLFNGPQLRSFGISYRLTARSRREADEIRKIIRFFKQGMSPKKRSGRGAGGASYFLKTPNVFRLNFKTTGNAENEAVSKFKTCALVSMQTDYTPDGFWVAYDEGQPVSTRITLQFAELEPIYDTDYQTDINSDRPDLSPVFNNSVGY